MAWGTDGALEGEAIAAAAREDLAPSVAARHDAPAVIVYDDVAFAGVLLRDPEAARSFAADELGRPAAPTRAAAELRETLSAFFANGHDQSRAANALAVHRNTVAKRLRRAEAALVIAEILGPGE